MSAAGLWRPPQWSKPAMVSVAVPPSQTVQQDANGNLKVNLTGATTYVFDAALRIGHSQRLTKTRHPVQTGADLSSHAYLEPARVTMSIGMSDAMASYSSQIVANNSGISGQTVYSPFTGNPSKSVSAYLTMLNLQASRQPLVVTTRLRTYRNMLIMAIEPDEDHRTIAGLRMRIEFEQIYTAVVVDTPVSARPADTSSTGLGNIDPQVPDTATVNQYNVDQVDTQTPNLDTGRAGNLLNFLRSHPEGVDAPGAGTYSSVNTNSLSQLPSP